MAADLLAFFIALFASLMLVVPVRALALRVGMVDLPGPRKVHLTPIPLLGGLAMYAAVVMAVLLAFNGPARAQIVGILIGATLVGGVGILDDRGLLHHQVKLFVGMPLAAAILVLGVTIFDTTLVTISRSRRGLLPFATPGKDHAAHRLSNLGLGHRGAVLTLYVLGALGGGAAVLVSYLSARMAFFVGVLACGIIFGGVAYLERAPYERQTPKTSTAS